MADIFRRILVPYDFSEQAAAALRVAATLARQHRGRLTVLHAIAPFYGVPTFPPGEQAAWVPPPGLVPDTRRRLDTLVARIARQAPSVRCHVVVAEPVRAILEAARGVDAIVMATVGRTGLAHLLIGSVAERVVRHSPVPVLTVRTGAAKRRARRAGAARARRPRRAR